MSNFHTAVYITREQKQFLDKNCMSATKLMQNYIQQLIEKERNSLSFVAETIPKHPITQREDVCII